MACRAVCKHEKRNEIEARLARGESYRGIAAAVSPPVSASAIGNHKRGCMPVAAVVPVAVAVDAREASAADSLLATAIEREAQFMAWAEAAAAAGQWGQAASCAGHAVKLMAFRAALVEQNPPRNVTGTGDAAQRPISAGGYIWPDGSGPHDTLPPVDLSGDGLRVTAPPDLNGSANGTANGAAH